MMDGSRSLNTNSALPLEWFKPEFLPQQIEIKTLILNNPSRVMYQAGVKFFLIEEGQGSILVNGIHFPLESGCCGLLYCYDFHRFIPNKNSSLKVKQLNCSYETFLFAAVLPGNEFSELQLTDRTIVLKPKRMKDLLRLIQILQSCAQCDSGDIFRSSLLLFELLARLNVLWRSNSLAVKISPAE